MPRSAGRVGGVDEEDSAPPDTLSLDPGAIVGLRTRLKRRVRALLGQPEAAAAPPAAASTRVEPRATVPRQSAAPTPPQAVPAAPAAPVSSAAPAAPAAAATGPDDEAKAKAARHFERTRRAVLKLIDDKGGTASLAEMHDYSERKYFIGHKRFSDLMETLLDESLIDFDHASGQAHITDNGRTLAHTKMPPRKKRAS